MLRFARSLLASILNTIIHPALAPLWLCVRMDGGEGGGGGRKSPIPDNLDGRKRPFKSPKVTHDGEEEEEKAPGQGGTLGAAKSMGGMDKIMQNSAKAKGKKLKFNKMWVHMGGLTEDDKVELTELDDSIEDWDNLNYDGMLAVAEELERFFAAGYTVDDMESAVQDEEERVSFIIYNMNEYVLSLCHVHVYLNFFHVFFTFKNMTGTY